MAIELSPEVKQLCEEVRRFIRKEVDPRSRWIEENDRWPDDLMQKTRELGLFGPAVMFGLGGIFAEVLKDVSFRLAPVTASVAREMVEEIAGYKVLAGARGKPPADVDALVDAIVRLSALAVDLKDHVAELDINPLFVFAKGKGVKAADALIRPKTTAEKNRQD